MKAPETIWIAEDDMTAARNAYFARPGVIGQEQVGRIEYRRADIVEAEIAELKERLDKWYALFFEKQDQAQSIAKERDELRQQVDALQQRVHLCARYDALIDYAEDAHAGFRYIEKTHGRLSGVGWDRVYAKWDALAASGVEG